jgi:hypothetical protein
MAFSCINNYESSDLFVELFAKLSSSGRHNCCPFTTTSALWFRPEYLEDLLLSVTCATSSEQNLYLAAGEVLLLMHAIA